MKWFHVLAIGFLTIALAGCNIIGNPGKNHAPSRASISGAKGLYLQASTAKSMHAARTAVGRSIVTATGATLGAITSAGIPETATFTDDTGAEVVVEITQGMQLTDEFVLISYSYDGGAGTGILDMANGNLASVSVVPENWQNIASTSGSMYFENGGTIYRTALSTGSGAALSSGSGLYAYVGPGTLSGSGNQPNVLTQASALWDSGAWIYVDGPGNVYALDMNGQGYLRAACIPEDGSPQVDFGSNALAYFFTSWLPTGSTGTSNQYAAVDSSTGNLYVVLSHDLWDGNPSNWGGANITGVALQVYQVAMNPTGTSNNGPVMSFTPGAPAAAIGLTSTYWPMTHVGFGGALQNGIYTKGAETLVVSVSGGASITDYDTSAVPVQSSGPGQVGNWQWSGGNVYAGPATQQTIGIVKLNGGTGTATTLVNDSSPIVSWSVVGGVLFYTDAMGTYSATVNTSAGTISTPQTYAGGAVQGVTQ